MHPGMQGWFSVEKSMNMMYHTNRVKEEDLDAERFSMKFQLLLRMKILNKLAKEEAYLNMLSAII